MAGSGGHSKRQRAGCRATNAWRSVACDHLLVQRFAVTIEGAGWSDVQVLELPRLPREGDLIETKYGTCRVTHSEATADTEPFDGKVVCSNS